jgi:hypothetical protein
MDGLPLVRETAASKAFLPAVIAVVIGEVNVGAKVPQ